MLTLGYIAGWLASRKYKQLPDWPETHRTGRVTIHNEELISQVIAGTVDLGVQISWDGRIWLCVDGVAWIRFKPERTAIDGAPST